jgi:hypothetical protein
MFLPGSHSGREKVERETGVRRETSFSSILASRNWTDTNCSSKLESVPAKEVIFSKLSTASRSASRSSEPSGNAQLVEHPSSLAIMRLSSNSPSCHSFSSAGWPGQEVTDAPLLAPHAHAFHRSRRHRIDSSAQRQCCMGDGDGNVHHCPDRSCRSSDDLMVSIGPFNPWRSALPGATNRTAFHRVGQALFSHLAGLGGGSVAVFFYGKRARGEETGTQLDGS